MPRLSKVGAAALAAFGWTGLSSVTATYLVVAGGGGGGSDHAGGGGAGGYRAGTESLNPTLSYTVTVGAGGTGGSASAGGNGNNSVFNTITSTGGGGGGSGTGTITGSSGGSGGGGGSTNGSGGAGGAGNTPSTSPSQGNNGGTGPTGGSLNRAGGGGGGASAVGVNGNVSTTYGTAGAGGAGTANSISGSSVTYAGGGGGGNRTVATPGAGGAGGAGGGGAGGGPSPGTGTEVGAAGTANLGGGGGGGANAGGGGRGGSGIVIISYAGAQKFGGGVVTSSGGNTIHTFTTSGTLVPVTPISASYLVVAGGGGGGYDIGAGAGAGGLLSGSGLTLDANSIYTVTVGSGGARATSAVVGSNGTNSVFSAISTAAVGGGGGASNGGTYNGSSGGSGGGGAITGTGGAGTSGQGNAGGNAGGGIGGGGGGGAGAVGATGTALQAGAGGAGSTSSISGSSVTYAGGGGAGGYGAVSLVAGAGGSGGGGAGGGTGAAGTAGTVNTGGGGGAGGQGVGGGGNGGSGIVIISYAGATQLMAGGTVTISGGNVIHTFTSSGYLTPLKLVNNSLRFRSSASAYLNRTPASASNRKTWTLSGWVKRGSLGGNQRLFYAGVVSTGAGLATQIYFAGDNLAYNDVNLTVANLAYIATTQVFRDPAAWYHIVISVDTTQATASNRVLIYVNGVQVTAFSSASYMTQNLDTQVNAAVVHDIGKDNGGSSYFDGYLTEINFIDGQALTPNSFGTFNSYGVWQPITYGGSYGTNGFYLPFTNNASTTTLGYDFSPNGNNWTTNNISLTAGATYDSMTDVPTLTSATAANYCVVNPLDNALGASITNGNLQVTSSGASWKTVRSTFALTTGSWYVELTSTTGTGNGNSFIGIVPMGVTLPQPVGEGSATSWGYSSNGNVYNNGSVISATGVTWSAGTTVAMTFDGSTLKFYNAGNLVATISSIPANTYAFGGSFYDNNAGAFNFGQRPFTYTPPTGFVALNTYNL